MKNATSLHTIDSTGTVTAITPPLVTLSGLPTIKPNELLKFENGSLGTVMHFDEETITAMILDTSLPTVGSTVQRTKQVLGITLDDSILGQTINAFGHSSSGWQAGSSAQFRPLEAAPLPISQRSAITQPLLTGVTLVDILLPLAQGQRQLIAGDRKTGKSPLLLQTTLTQIASQSIVVFASIGKSKNEVRSLQEFLEKHQLHQSLVIVASTAQDAPSVISLTPYTAMTVAEYFRDQGKNVVVIFDDLTTHAKFYREIALLARNFPGRDSYPGDIFYTHARLLERAGSFNLDGKASTITALPVAETTGSELTDYIVSNLISITDGHLLFSDTLFQRGQRPAIDTTLSVTRVGKQTRSNLLRQLNRALTVELNKLEKMRNMSHFGAELTDDAKTLLARGELYWAYFDQPELSTTPLTVQVVGLGMIIAGLFDAIAPANLHTHKEYLETRYHENKKLREALDAFLSAENLEELTKEILKNTTSLRKLCQI